MPIREADDLSSLRSVGAENVVQEIKRWDSKVTDCESKMKKPKIGGECSYKKLIILN